MSAADVEQGTQEWREARAGYVTASRICDVLRKPKRGQKESATRKAYMAQLITERLTGKPVEQEFESWDTRRGTRLEPFARAEYELKCDLEVRTIGFVEHPTIKLAGGSPDALVGTDGLAQFKCPRAHVHLDYLLAGIVPTEYRPQMLFEMSCTGRKWNDFVSYNQDLPDHLQIFVARLLRDDAEIKTIEDEVCRFNAELEAIIGRLPKHAGDEPLERTLEESLKVVSERTGPMIP